jgi:hypothetical protein
MNGMFWYYLSGDIDRMRWKILLLLLLVPALVVQAAGKGEGRARGKKLGGYTTRVVGEFNGEGSVAVSEINISLELTLTYKDGKTATAKFPNLKLVDDHFSGKSVGNPAEALTIAGRVDLPAATDIQMTEEQAYTGRVMATLTDSGGKSALLVAIQKERVPSKE